MPGESRPDEQPIPFDPKPQTVALESQIDSLRDEVVDLVALRARLEARMKARLEGEDWTGLEATLKEFARLTPRDDSPSGSRSSRTTPPISRPRSRKPHLDQDGPGPDQRPSVDDRPLPGRRHVQGLRRRTRARPSPTRCEGARPRPRKRQPFRPGYRERRLQAGAARPGRAASRATRGSPTPRPCAAQAPAPPPGGSPPCRSGRGTVKRRHPVVSDARLQSRKSTMIKRACRELNRLAISGNRAGPGLLLVARDLAGCEPSSVRKPWRASCRRGKAGAARASTGCRCGRTRL